MQRLWAPVALFAFALAVRGLSFASVFQGSRIQFFDYDSYYHMRRVLQSLAHFPSVLAFDPYLNFPHGGQPIWPPLFDRCLAFALWPFQRPQHPQSVERIAVWIPPLLGAATAVAAYCIASRHFGRAAAWLCAGLLCVLPAHFAYSQLGYIDHHVAVGLASALLLGAGMAFLARDEEGWGAPDLLLALLPGGCLLLWPGMLLEVALTEVALLGWLLCAPDAQRAAARAGRLAVLHAVSLALVLPGGLTTHWQLWGDFSPVVISRFQPWLFASLCLHALACRLLWRRSGGATLARRVVDAAAVGVVLAGASLLLVPGLAGGAADAWRWLTRAEAFQSSVWESRPLFVRDGRIDATDAQFYLSRALYLFPLALAGFAWDARRRPDRAARWLLLAWSLCFALLAAAQRRFVHVFALPFALVLGASLPLLQHALAARLPDRRLRAGLGAAGVALLLWLLLPVTPEYRFHLHNLSERLARRPVALSPHVMRARAASEAALWLRDHSPPTAGFLDPSEQPEYGVLSDYGYGHLISYVARRPAVVGNFGDDVGGENLEAVVRFLYAEPEQALPILEGLRARYVLMEVVGEIPERFAPRAMLRLLAGVEPAPPPRLRWRYESSDLLRPRFRIFELLPEPAAR
jgi:dolichyl-diphosphooligosaccharide--protein glycosyltransferase